MNHRRFRLQISFLSLTLIGQVPLSGGCDAPGIDELAQRTDHCSPGSYYVTAEDGLLVRAAPGTANAIVTSLAFGQEAQVLAIPAQYQDGYTWCAIEDRDSYPARAMWVADSYLAPAPLGEPTVNLLSNQGLEEFENQCDRSGVTCDRAQRDLLWVPKGWTAWWQQPECQDRPCAAWGIPRFTDTTAPEDIAPRRTMAGDSSLKMFTAFSVHDAGIYQVVDGLSPGDVVSFSIYLQSWSSENATPLVDPDGDAGNADMNLQVGIDPSGGTDPNSASIVWTSTSDSPGAFSPFGVDAVADSERISVWVRSSPRWARRHNHVYADEAILVVTQPAEAGY